MASDYYSGLGSAASTRHQRFKTRRFIRLNQARWPFVFWGLLPLLGLLALTWFAVWPFAQYGIEDSVRTQTRAALDQNDMQWVQLNVSGQDVFLSGTEPHAGAGDEVETLIWQQRCPTWAGPKTCAVKVIKNFTFASVPPASIADITPAAPAIAPVVIPDFQFSLREGVLQLAAELPSEALKQQLSNVAKALLAPPRIASIDNQLTVKEQSVFADYNAVAERGLANLSRCQEGRSALTGGVYSLRCTVLAADEAAVRQTATADFPIPIQLGTVELIAKELVSSCEKEFADLLANSKIEFATGSAQISSSSDNLIDQLATKAKQCPGIVRIEGHTDSVGRLKANMRLSQDRAASVKAALINRGIAEQRLQSEGYGPNQPIESNDSAAGRAKNRRIEFKIVTF